MTLPASGQLAMNQINAEFGRGNDLNAYRGTPWWTDAGASGNFPTGQIAFSDFWGKRVASPLVPLSLVYRGAVQSSNTGGSISLNNFAIGDPVANRNVIVVGDCNDSNAPSPTTCTVSGIACTRVVVRGGNAAIAIFITNSPLDSGTTASATVGYSGSSVSNRAMGAYTVVGNINRTPGQTFTSTPSAQSLAVSAGGIIIAALGRHSNTAVCNFVGVNLDQEGINAGSHRWGWGSYSAPGAETRAVSCGGSGSFVGASFNLL